MAHTRTSHPAEVTLESAYQSSFGDLALALGTISVIVGVILYSLR